MANERTERNAAHFMQRMQEDYDEVNDEKFTTDDKAMCIVGAYEMGRKDAEKHIQELKTMIEVLKLIKEVAPVVDQMSGDTQASEKAEEVTNNFFRKLFRNMKSD